MTFGFPAIVSFVGAVPFFMVAAKARKFKVSETPPVSRAGMTIEERQRKVRVGSWIAFAGGCGMLAGGIILAILSTH